MSSRPYRACLLLLLLAGVTVRFTGLTRGSGDGLLPGEAAAASATPFYHFHPDETMVLQAEMPRLPGRKRMPT